MNNKQVQILHFVYDITMIVESEDLDKILSKMNNSNNEYNIKNVKNKTKKLICSKNELI